MADSLRISDSLFLLIGSAGFGCQSLPFGRRVLLMINVLRVLWSIAVNFYLFSAMNSCQRGVTDFPGLGFSFLSPRTESILPLKSKMAPIYNQVG